MEKETVFKRHYQDYLAQFENISFKSVAPNLGGTAEADGINIAFFGMNYFISARGISDPLKNKPSYDVCVILSKYLLLCPTTSPKETEWVSFRNFKDSGPLITYFNNNVEKSIASFFKRKLDSLKKASHFLSGYRPNLDVRYDLAVQFDALPRIPVILLFNDADEEFPAKCSVLFERCAEKYLDAECLAILGWQLFIRLQKASDIDRCSEPG